ncbi:hypothetical protein [Actinomycetospora atypica]|uniref:STAS domain-containing protein n=1 Tax=Actinomycetospora atypica TaxID=1290095 RepID=A0ABV9YTF6_9PSEU
MTDPATAAEEVATCPAARVAVRRPGPGSVVLTFSGEGGRDDAAILSRCVHREMDRGATLVVVQLRHEGPAPRWLAEVLRVARDRAHREGIGLRVVACPAGGDHGLEVSEPS